MSALILKAGPTAMALIRKEGLHADLFSHFGAAAGGPKWLVLRHLDEAMFGGWLGGRSTVMHAVGSSIGAWRLACLAQSDVPAALARFEQAYIHQTYSERPDAAEVSREAERILAALLGESGLQQILEHPWLKLNVIACHCEGLLASERPVLQQLGLFRIVLANLLSRRRYARHLGRAVFHVPEAAVRYAQDGFQTQYLPVDEQGLLAALRATAAIPLVLRGEPAFGGALPGMYRDGGLVDYHMDLPLEAPKGLMLLPHFFERVVTGWFDKFMRWRKPRCLDRTLLIAPSADMLARLPNGKVPDRRDFKYYAGDDSRRIADWRRAVAETERMAEEWQHGLASGALIDRIELL